MLEIKVNIEATTPDLSAAISKLADALKGSIILSPGGVETQLQGVQAEELQPINADIIKTGVIPNPNGPNMDLNKGFDGIASAIAQTSAETPTQVAQQQFMNPPVTAAPMIDLDTISRAGAALIDQGRTKDVLDLLAKFGVPAVNLLDPSQYPAFAEGLKALGASI